MKTAPFSSYRRGHSIYASRIPPNRQRIRRGLCGRSGFLLLFDQEGFISKRCRHGVLLLSAVLQQLAVYFMPLTAPVKVIRIVSSLLPFGLI